MALDSGIHAGMTVFSRSVGLVYNDERLSVGTIKGGSRALAAIGCKPPPVLSPWGRGSYRFSYATKPRRRLRINSVSPKPNSIKIGGSGTGLPITASWVEAMSKGAPFSSLNTLI